jgi:hypothetical protein
MNRAKFLVFAVVALGLWGYHLSGVSSTNAALGVDQAATAVAGAPPAVALRVEARRSDLQAAALKLASTSAGLQASVFKNGKIETPSVERFTPVRAAASEAVAEADRAELVVILTNEAGALMAEGAAEPAAPVDFDVSTLAQDAASGKITAYKNTAYLFYSVPAYAIDKAEMKRAGSILVGRPLLPNAAVLDTVAQELHLSAVGIVVDGAVALAGGPEKAQVEASAKKLKSAGTIAPLASSAVREFGPISLPIFVDPVTSVAARQAITGTPYEVVAVASSRGAMVALAATQVFAIGGLLGLGLLTLVVLLLIRESDDEEVRMVVPAPVPVPSVQIRAKDRAKEAEPTNLPPAPPAPVEAAPEASPDDFHFPPSAAAAVTAATPVYAPPPVAAEPVAAVAAPRAQLPQVQTDLSPVYQPPPQPQEPEPTTDPFASLSGMPQSVPLPGPGGFHALPSIPLPGAQPSSKSGLEARPSTEPEPYIPASGPPLPKYDEDEDQDKERTMAYPVPKGGEAAMPGMSASPFAAFTQPAAGGAAPQIVDPFALAGAGASGEEQGDKPDSTRVASIPQELLNATLRSEPLLSPVAARAGGLAGVQSIAPVSSGLSEEERHFQEIFRDFISAREKCGEVADGLTFDKFRVKLLKNKDQLVTKYGCKTVRFQVYVKDGKAALKATPVKEA